MAVALYFTAIDPFADLASMHRKRLEKIFLLFCKNLIARSASFAKRFAVVGIQHNANALFQCLEITEYFVSQLSND